MKFKRRWCPTCCQPGYCQALVWHLKLISARHSVKQDSVITRRRSEGFRVRWVHFIDYFHPNPLHLILEETDHPLIKERKELKSTSSSSSMKKSRRRPAPSISKQSVVTDSGMMSGSASTITDTDRLAFFEFRVFQSFYYVSECIESFLWKKNHLKFWFSR